MIVDWTTYDARKAVYLEVDHILDQLEEEREMDTKPYELDPDERCFFEEVLNLAHGTN